MKNANWFMRMMSDGEDPSTMRFIAITVLIPLNVIPLFIWAHANYHVTVLTGLPLDVGGFVGSVNTVILGALHLNKRIEASENIASENAVQK